MKDRLDITSIDDALASGKIRHGGTIIEPTAGNTGIGLVLAARNKDLTVIFCVPEQFSIEKQQLMKALGATIFSLLVQDRAAHLWGFPDI